MMEAVRFPETKFYFNEPTRLYTPENSSLLTHRSENWNLKYNSDLWINLWKKKTLSLFWQAIINIFMFRVNHIIFFLILILR
jgi:hypothetical protein